MHEVDLPTNVYKQELSNELSFGDRIRLIELDRIKLIGKMLTCCSFIGGISVFTSLRLKKFSGNKVLQVSHKMQ